MGQRRGRVGAAHRREARNGVAAGVVKLGDLEKIARVRRAAQNNFLAGRGALQNDFIRAGIIAGGHGVAGGRGDVGKHLLQRIRGGDVDLLAVDGERAGGHGRGKPGGPDRHTVRVAAGNQNIADAAGAVEHGGGGQIGNVKTESAGQTARTGTGAGDRSTGGQRGTGFIKRRILEFLRIGLDIVQVAFDGPVNGILLVELVLRLLPDGFRRALGLGKL